MSAQPNTPEVVGMILSSRVGTFLVSAGLPRSLSAVKDAKLIMARKGREEESSTVASITSFDFELNRKAITLYLSATRFLAGENPTLHYMDGKWVLYVFGNNPHSFDDIEFALI